MRKLEIVNTNVVLLDEKELILTNGGEDVSDLGEEHGEIVGEAVKDFLVIVGIFVLRRFVW